MFGTTSNPVNAYAQVSIESTVNSADPHGLILLLFEGAASAMSMAKLSMELGDHAKRSANISKAVDLLTNGLKAGLNVEAGGELAERLSALYDYIVQRLLWANMKNDRAAIEEAEFLLKEIHTAWVEIKPAASTF